MACKFCKSSPGTIDIIWKSLHAYSDERNGQFQPLVQIECRGWEPREFIPSNGIFKCRGSESNTPFNEVDLSEDWAEYDEKAKESVEIMVCV
jgi:hypothetical protein